MKSILYIALLYIALSLLVISCTEADPEPTCIGAEVMGADCEAGWYILKLDESAAGTVGGYKGQLQGGFVTTDNLPEAYRYPGTKLQVALERNGMYSPKCVTVAVMYTSVKVKKICSAEIAG